MSQGEPAEARPEPEPRAGAGLDEAHKGQLLVQEALSVITAVVRTLIDLVADLQAWCTLLESRANEADAVDVLRQRRELAEHQDRLVAAQALLAGARTKREAAEELAIAVRRSGGDPSRGGPIPAPPLTPLTGAGADSTAPPGSRTAATKSRLSAFDRALETADEQLVAYDAQMAAVRELVGARSEPNPADAVPESATTGTRTKTATAAAGETETGTDGEADAEDAPEDRKPQAPLWTTWCTVLTGCSLLLAVILGGTSFTYARWEEPGAGTMTAYAVGDLLALGVVVFASLMVLGTLVEYYELSTLGETSLVLAILLVLPVLGVGLWHPQAFGHMGMWGRSLARALV